LKNGFFNLAVSNKISTKSSLAKKNSGIGVNNLEKRLKHLYQDRYKLNKAVDGDIYAVTLKIKLEK